MHEVLVNRLLGGLSLPRKSVVRFTDRPNMTLDVYRGRKTTMQQIHSVLARNCKISKSKNAVLLSKMIFFSSKLIIQTYFERDEQMDRQRGRGKS